MRRLLVLAVLLLAAAAGCQAIDNDPILGKSPFQPAGFTTATGK
jgi:hypothetical protein